MTLPDGNLDDGAEVPEFRSLSPLAALSLVLGLASPVALVTPLMVIVPVAAVLFGLLALVKIRSSAGALAGDGLARWGIALALAAIAASLVRAPVRDALLRKQARVAAGDWLELMAAQRYDDARLLLSSQALQAMAPKKAPSLEGAEEPEAEDFLTIIREKLRADKVARQLAEFKRPMSISAVPAAGNWPLFEPPRTILTEDFTVRSAGEGAEPLLLQIRLVRARFYEEDGRPWRVDHWQLIQPGASSGAPAALP
jgi:hypothetical protein